VNDQARRHALWLAVIALVWLAAPVVVRYGLGWSGGVATLAAVLVGALAVPPVLINVEGLKREMRWGRFR
jgi:hypothetical protein